MASVAKALVSFRKFTKLIDRTNNGLTDGESIHYTRGDETQSIRVKFLSSVSVISFNLGYDSYVSVGSNKMQASKIRYEPHKASKVWIN